MFVTLQNHSGIPNVLQVSRGRAATHIVQIDQQGAVRRHHKVFMSPARRHEAPAKIMSQVRIVPLRHVRSIRDYPSALPPSLVTDIRTIVRVPHSQ